MKRFLIILISTVMCFSISACTDKKVQNDMNEGESIDLKGIDLSWYREDDCAICDGLYVVGEDIKEGKYYLSHTCFADCKATMYVVVFETLLDYLTYQQEDKSLAIDKSNALNKTMLYDLNIRDNTATINLKNDNVVMICQGHIGRLCSEQDIAMRNAKTYGLIKVSEEVLFKNDIKRGKYIFTATHDTAYSSNITIFRDKESYKNYLNYKGYMASEERNSFEKYGWYTIPIFDKGGVTVGLHGDLHSS